MPDKCNSPCLNQSIVSVPQVCATSRHDLIAQEGKKYSSDNGDRRESLPKEPGLTFALETTPYFYIKMSVLLSVAPSPQHP